MKARYKWQRARLRKFKGKHKVNHKHLGEEGDSQGADLSRTVKKKKRSSDRKNGDFYLVREKTRRFPSGNSLVAERLFQPPFAIKECTQRKTKPNERGASVDAWKQSLIISFLFLFLECTFIVKQIHANQQAPLAPFVVLHFPE